mmetsp:Transcript_22396/g.32805  ORF Transcript_22396/g.32805 Transcript_22396/m.32805 type:complete len:252 (+) Transcript_22396:125-880(+)
MCHDVLKREEIRLVVPNLLEVGDARKVDHGRRATHPDERARAGLGHALRKHFIIDETLGVGPVTVRHPLRQSVDSVVDFHAVREVLCPAIQILAQQNVVGRLVGVQEEKFGGIIGVLECLLHDLVGRCDASSAADEAQLLNHSLVLVDLDPPVAKVREVSDGALDVNRVAKLERLEVLRHFAAVREARVGIAEVYLNHHFNKPDVVVERRWRVSAHTWRAIDLRVDEKVVANRQPEHMLRRGQRKTQTPYI